MKAKKTISDHNNKLTVESYEVKDGVLICQAGREGDEENTEHEVSIEELQKYICNSKGQVDVTDRNNTEITYPVDFWTWFDNEYEVVMCDYLSDILNNRERSISTSVVTIGALTALKNILSSKIERRA